MNAERAKRVIRRIAAEIWNQGRLEVVDEVMAPDGRYYGPHMPGGIGTRDDWRGAIGMYRSAFPDSHVVYDELLVSDDAVVGRWSATGTHTGDLPVLLATGKAISISGITIYRMAGDQITEAWEQLDLLGMWQQLGSYPPARHS